MVSVSLKVHWNAAGKIPCLFVRFILCWTIWIISVEVISIVAIPMDHYDFNQDDVSETDMIEGSDSNDNSESDFEGFNSDDVNGAQQ